MFQVKSTNQKIATFTDLSSKTTTDNRPLDGTVLVEVESSSELI